MFCLMIGMWYNNMITVKELELMCSYISSEYGHDSKVCIKMYDDEGNFKGGDYALVVEHSNDGTLYISNEIKKR